MGVELTTVSNDVMSLSTINNSLEVIATVNNNKMVGWFAKSGKRTSGETNLIFSGK